MIAANASGIGTSSRPPCPICGTGDTTRAFVRNGYDVWRCRACGLRLLWPQPDDATLAGVYNSDYFLGDRSVEGEGHSAGLKHETARRYVKALCAYPLLSGGRRLLEIGCGVGEFLIEADAVGFVVQGLEVSPHAAAVANQRLGAERVHVGPLEKVALPSDSFDVIAFSDVIEHIRDPLAFLQRVHSLLRPGGAVLLVTPSVDSWSAVLLGRHWMEYKVEHLYYFGKRSLGAALKRAGFTEITMRANQKTLSLDYVARHFARFPVPVVGSAVCLLRAATPDGLAHRPVNVRASGLLALARKPVSSQPY